jgi:hypothetical protein
MSELKRGDVAYQVDVFRFGEVLSPALVSTRYSPFGNGREISFFPKHAILVHVFDVKQNRHAVFPFNEY